MDSLESWVNRIHLGNKSLCRLGDKRLCEGGFMKCAGPSYEYSTSAKCATFFLWESVGRYISANTEIYLI